MELHLEPELVLVLERGQAKAKATRKGNGKGKGQKAKAKANTKKGKGKGERQKAKAKGKGKGKGKGLYGFMSTKLGLTIQSSNLDSSNLRAVQYVHGFAFPISDIKQQKTVFYVYESGFHGSKFELGQSKNDGNCCFAKGKRMKTMKNTVATRSRNRRM